jgi:predicted DNA-binding mobile mystery protein A
MTAAQLGSRVGVRAQSIADMESSEASGQIQLSTLRKVAEAMDCHLVCAFVPNSSLAKTVERQARKVASLHLARVEQSMRLEDQSTPASGREERIQSIIRDVLREKDLWSEP